MTASHGEIMRYLCDNKSDFPSSGSSCQDVPKLVLVGSYRGRPDY